MDHTQANSIGQYSDICLLRLQIYAFSTHCCILIKFWPQIILNFSCIKRKHLYFCNVWSSISEYNIGFLSHLLFHSHTLKYLLKSTFWLRFIGTMILKKFRFVKDAYLNGGHQHFKADFQKHHYHQNYDNKQLFPMVLVIKKQCRKVPMGVSIVCWQY